MKVIGYVLADFPALSETFVGNEMRAMADRGHRVVPIIMHRLNGPAQPEDVRLADQATTLGMARLSHAITAALRPGASATRALTFVARQKRLGRLSLLLNGLKIGAVARREGCTHLHAHFAGGAAAHAIVAARWIGATVSFIGHGHDIYSEPEDLAAKLTSVDFVIGTCADMVGDFESIVPEVKAYRIPCGTDPDRFQAINANEDNGRFLLIGRLAYAAAKRLRESEGAEGSARQIEATLQELKTAGLPAPVWSIADEPSNPDQGGKGLREWVADLRRFAPEARLAGHLNASADIALLSLFDVVLVNQGYGIDLERLQKTANKGRDVWLYNTGKPRFSAGLWLWRTPATRYLQWHARMPTADPFDPTDGREGDVQALLPGRDVCAATPDINENVLDMAEGLVDQRWLAWLDTEPRAADLRARILARLGTAWRTASTLDGREMDDLRRDIETLARTLK